MSQTTADESFWLEANWATTSRTILKLVHPLCGEVVDEIIANGEPSERTWTRFVNAAALALDRKRRACAQDDGAGRGNSPRRTMYACAVSLFGDAAPMRHELVGARERLSDGAREAVAWACLRSALFRMRHRMSSEIENRSKTWRRLELISAQVMRDRVAKGRARDGDSRCSPEHFEAMADYIGRVYPTDRNLPTDADGVGVFFVEFSSDFATSDPIDDMQGGDMQGEQIEMMPDYNRGMAYLDLCLGELGSPADEVCAVKLQRGAVVDLNASVYCRRTGMERTKFHRILNAAMEALSDCIKDKFAAKSLVPSS